jgi:hypothetical protein
MTCEVRFDLFERIHPFSGEREFEIGKPGDVAARPCKAFDETLRNGLGHQREYHRYGPGFLLQRVHRPRAKCYDDVGRRADDGRRGGVELGGVGDRDLQVD